MGQKTTNKIAIIYLLLTLLGSNSLATDTQKYNNGLRLMQTPYTLHGETTTCLKCHVEDEPTIFFWKPSLAEISIVAQKLDSITFNEQLLQPFSERLTVDHDGIKITNDEVSDIHYFLTHITPDRLRQTPSSNPVPLGGVLGIIMFISLVEMWIFPFFKKRYISKIILIAALLFGGHLLGKEFSRFGIQESYAPIQPIKFSHKVHSDQNKISCFYCHSETRQGAKAGIPSTQACMNCHTIITEGGNSGEFYIKQLQEADKNHTAIQWVKVHNLPDHVHFNHARHVVNGKLDCTKCHGDVANMDRVKQQESLSMKWCLDCHSKSQTNTIGEQLQPVSETGGFDCMQCHY